MKAKKYKPTSPARRFITTIRTDHLTKKRPEKSLTEPLKKKAGRSRGKISVRHRGGGHKRMYRIIDFKRNERVGVAAEVIALEYDPNRTSHIALIQYEDGHKTYIISPEGLQVGDQLMNGEGARIRIGNALPLRAIPVGVEVHNIEIKPGKGGRVVRSAGQTAKVMAREDKWVHVRLPSGEVRLFNADCYATIGQVSNPHHAQRVLGKAGTTRHLGRRPKVRGVAMSAGDHAHGGGEGRTGTGRVPKTPWGKLAHGKPTRKKNKSTDKYIIKNRRKKK